MTDVELVRDALRALPPDLPYNEWVRVGMAMHAAGAPFEVYDEWSAGSPNYNPRAARDRWRSFKAGRGIGPGTLFAMAKAVGWSANVAPAPISPAAASKQSCTETSRALIVWRRATTAAATHGYIAAKNGVPDGLRVLPLDDPLTIAGHAMGGALVVPVLPLDGASDEPVSLQFVGTPEQSARWKAADHSGKLNLPGAPMRGVFVVGARRAGSVVYIVEGVGQAWACWKATGHAAVMAFGWGNVRRVAGDLRRLDSSAGITIVPDRGKETEAEAIALEVGGSFVRMPDDALPNFDANDYAAKHGHDGLQALLAGAHEPPKPAAMATPRRLDFASLAGRSAPPGHWFRDGWLGGGVTLLPGAGGSGKSNLMQYEATAGSLGLAYFAPACRPYRTLVWNCEDGHDELWRRQEGICAHAGIDMASLPRHLILLSRYGCDNALMAEVQRALVSTPLLDELRQQVNDERIDVLYLDNTAHVFLGDHDDRTQVTRFINALNGLVTGRPFGVVLAAHVSRVQGSEYTGSVAWENAARMRWYLGNRLPDAKPLDVGEPDDKTVRYLCRRKSNYSALDRVRMTMQRGVLVPDAVASEGLNSGLADKRAEQVCVAGFKALTVMGIKPSDSAGSTDYLPRQMLDKALAKGCGKLDLTRAIDRLMSRGTFTRGVVGKYANRSPKYGLILIEEGQP